MLQQEFTTLLTKYTNNSELVNRLWNEIEIAYSDGQRYFHNLSHLEQIFTALKPFQQQIEDWDTLSFAIFYHDVVYNAIRYMTANDNEEKSAEQAENVLTTIHYPAEKIERCKQHILATKKHQLSADRDANFLTDADLCILGQSWELYDAYMKNIRKEYAVYPEPVYKAGRIKLLQNFLQMERLFKTQAFHQVYETGAKENIQKELEILLGYSSSGTAIATLV